MASDLKTNDDERSVEESVYACVHEFLGDDPDEENFQQDLDEITSLEARAEDIISLITHIDQRQGVCQADAVSLEAIDETLLGERYPVQSFTVKPSKTNYQITMEGALQRAGEFIKELVKKLVGLIRKVFDWIINTFFRFGKKADDTEKKAKKAEVDRSAQEKIEENVPGEVKEAIADKNKEHQQQFSQAMVERYNALLDETLFGREGITDVIKGFGEDKDVIFKKIHRLLDKYFEALHFTTIPTHEEVHKELLLILDKIAQRHDYDKLIDAAKKLKGIPSRPTLQEIAEEFYSQVKTLRADDSTSPPNIEDMVRQMEDMWSLIEEYRDLGVEEVEKAKERISDIEAIDFGPLNYPEFFKQIRQYQSMVINDIKHISYILKGAQLVLMEIDSFVTAIGNYNATMLRSTEQAARDSEDADQRSIDKIMKTHKKHTKKL